MNKSINVIKTSKLLGNNHIRFDDNDDDDDDDEDVNDNSDENVEEKNDFKNLDKNIEEQDKSVKLVKLNFNLVKNRQKKEKSFGFHLKGDATKNGDHFIDFIDENSASDRVGLKKFDKIIKVNGINVEKLNINNLINLIEYETSLNDLKLNLEIQREKFNQESSSKRLLCLDNSEEDKIMSKKKQIKVQPIDIENITFDQAKTSSQAQLNDLTGFVSAVDIEKHFCTSMTNTELIDEAPMKTIEQIRLENIQQIRFISPYRPYKRPNIPSKMILNVKAKEIQKKLSEQGKYVNWQEVIYELLKQYEGCEHIGDLGLLQADNLEAIHELIRLQKRIDTVIISAEFKVPFITILDIEQSIVSDYNHNLLKFNPNSKCKITKFEEIYVGPIIKNQLIRQVFNIVDDVSSSKQLKLLKGSDLVKSLVTYLQENNLWGQKVKQAEFESFLIQKYKVDSINMLGVRIINLGMLIGCLKTVQHLYSESLKETKNEIDAEFKHLFQNEKIWLFKKLNEKILFYNNSLDYLNSNSIDIVEDFLKLFEKVLDRNEYYYINDFLSILKDSTYLRDCFQLAICLGKHDLNKCIDQIEANMNDEENEFYHKYKSLLKRLFFLMIDTKTRTNRELKRFMNRCLRDKGLKIVDSGHKKFDDGENEDEPSYSESDQILDTTTTTTSQINDLNKNYEEKLIDLIKTKLDSNTILTFDHLIKIENNLYENLSYNFIELLKKNKYLFDQNGLKINLIDSESEISSNLNMKNKDLNYDFIIKQDTILNQETNIDNNFKQEEILNKIKTCKLLDNLYEHLNWSFYEHTHGDFRQFVDKLNSKILNNNEKIYLLELDPNTKKYLKLTSQTSIEQLKESIETINAQNTSGHLISLICLKYKSLQQAPKSLLINEIQSSLSKLLKNCLDKYPNNNYFNSLLAINETDVLNRKFYTYIIDLILNIPVKILTKIIFTYILEPLIKLNSDHQIKEKLFRVLAINSYLSGSNEIDKKIDFFLQLGSLCSINEWSITNYKLIIQNLSTKLEQNIQYTNQANNKTDDELIERVESVKEPIIKIQKKIINNNQEQTLNKIEANISDKYSQIELIRERYGIGLELNEETKLVTESLKGVIGRSLESLSNELYNKEMHFVLELIQNADDNTYPCVLNHEPTLIFLIENDCISLFNNEIGFSDKNINAICDVKASTKGKHQSGYIGRKGIGFKSVFTVTDRPEIHSNGYHVKFDLSNGHIGYILPNWISNLKCINDVNEEKQFILDRIESSIDKSKIGQLNTCIRLPLKSESDMQKHKSSLLTNNFNDIKSYLLLFLNRLKNLVIINNINSIRNELIFHRQDLDLNLIEIRSNLSNDFVHNNSEQKWFVVRDSLQVPVNLRPNDDIESTDLCFAFPISDKLDKMDVFAYLPLRSFGFKFIIQADFVVPASRQDINQDSDWNQWIIRHIPKLFVRSFYEFKQHKIFQSSDDQFSALKSYLKFIPLEEEIIGCFQHVSREIFDMLRNEEFLPAIDENGHDIVLKRPFECVIVKDDELIRQVLTSDLLKKYLGRFYLHESLLKSNDINHKLMLNLGVHYLNINDIIEIVKSVFSLNQFNDTKTCSKWLCVLQHCLNGSYSLQQEEKFIKQLKSLEFIPILRYDYETNSYMKEITSLDKTNVFFSNTKSDHKNEKIINMIKKDLNLLDTESLLCLDELKNAQIVCLLKSLGVNQIDPFEIIENHIIKVFESDDVFKTKPDEIKILYVLFINTYFDKYHFNLSKLKQVIKLKTNKGFLSLLNENIYLTSLYGNKHDFNLLFPSYEWTLIDDVYFKQSLDLISSSKKLTNEQLALNWRKLFNELGLMDVFVPKLKETKLNNLENSDYFKQLSKMNYEIKINEFLLVKDFECDIVNFYMNLISKCDLEQPDDNLVKELTNLYRILEEYWDKNYSLSLKSLNSFKFASVYLVTDLNQQGKILKENAFESSYYQTLKYSKWICAENFKYISSVSSSKIDLKKQIKLREASSLFSKEQVFLSLYSNQIEYTLNQPFKDKSTFGHDLGFKFEFNLSEFLSKFQEWHQNSSKFYTNLSQMKNIYLLISNQLNSCDLKQDVSNQLNLTIKNQSNFIFVPDMFMFIDKEKSNEKYYSGTFYQPSQVYWYDPTGLFIKYQPTNFTIPIMLEPFYGQSSKSEQLKNIFINEFKIDSTPTLNNYISLLSHISLLSSTNKTPFTYEQTLNDVFKIYEYLIDKCMQLTCFQTDYNQPNEIIINDNIKTYLLSLINDLEIIPCFKNKWLSVNDRKSPAILVDNDFELAEKFVDKINIVITNSCASDDFYDLCKSTNMNKKLEYFFYNIFNLNIFSNVLMLDLENITTELSECPHVQNECRKLLPYIQSFIFYRPELKILYDYLTQNEISKRLKSMKFYSVKELENIYRFKHDPLIYAKVSNKTCVDTNEKSTYWKYFIRFDLINNPKDMIRGFIKLFLNQRSINEKIEKELINFCLFIYQFINFKINDDDVKEIEKDYNLKLNLPFHIEKWIIDENKSNLISNNIEDNQADLINFKASNKPKQNSDLITKRQKLLAYDQLSRNQLNLPQTEVRISALNVSDKSVESINNNLNNLARKMSTNFELDSINNKTEIINIDTFNNNFVNFSNNFQTSSIKNELDLIRSSISMNDMNKNSREFIFSIGKWGELWVNEMLKQKYKTELENNWLKIEWMNEHGESGLPYDFRLINLMNNDIDGTAIFIEVKSTTKMSQESFPISYQELLFAQKYSSQFEIYRLYNCANEDPNQVRLKIIRDIPKLLYTHGINLFILI